MTEPTTTTRQLWRQAAPKRILAIGVSRQGEPFTVYDGVENILIRAKLQTLQKEVLPHVKQ